MVVPVAVSSASLTCTLFAIWANNPIDPDGQYVEQIWKAINYYDEFLTEKPTILIGDFNSNTIWDRKSRVGNHSDVVKVLEAKNIFSCYHIHFNLEQGKEKHPTLYWKRHKDKPYHIDFAFISGDLLRALQTVEIGEFEFWIKYSDHMPIILSFNIS